MSDNLLILNYSDLWLKFGFLTEEDLNDQIKIFETSDDKSTEHYRYASFEKYLRSQRKFTDNEVDQYLELAAIDEDKVMSGAAGVDLLTLADLTNHQFEKICVALSLFGEWTEKVILRQTLFRKLKKEAFTEELFLECFNKGSGEVHRVLIEYANKSQMELIAEKGASKSVRNIAKEKLGSRKFR